MFGARRGDAAPPVRVPRVHRDATTRRVLATEWVDGATPLAQSPPAVIRRLAPAGVECFLAQLLEIGFFHSDPHPGNLLVDADGRLTLIDFGLCADLSLIHISEPTRPY